jgi:hypothetical protein
MKNSRILFIALFTLGILPSCKYFQASDGIVLSPQWEEITINLKSTQTYSNPYTDVEVYAVFTHETYGHIRRPAFWDGENAWKIRFASPVADGEWTWESFCSNLNDDGLHGIKGNLVSVKYVGKNNLIRHGLLRMSQGKRNVIHADGTPFFMVADTPWSLPFRATHDDARHYASDRQEKGFNTALLMTFCPDRHAEGPDARDSVTGFARAFNDIWDGNINDPIIPYFQYLDTLISILVDHEIVPVHQPIFHGYGWKGLQLLGWDMDPAQYERYMKYLIARYGAQPAMWLVSGDADARFPGIAEAGVITQMWDDYQQPTGLHYSPFDTITPDWWDRDYEYIPHFNKVHQDAGWNDFQWCQTGHGGEHLFYMVQRMYENLPVKATANGEPTYEGIRDSLNGSGWWQGHEAWGQLVNGGSMGVVYGAGGLWNWKITSDEEGWPGWANSAASWKQALDLPGSTFVGYLAKALKGFDITDIERKQLPDGTYYLDKQDKTTIVYLPNGGTIQLNQLKTKTPFEWFNPQTGLFQDADETSGLSQTFASPDDQPWVLLIGERK